ncbi:hypothetical protein EB1_25470 [Empedobacter brevis NBRC 14943 = ATCC 43319]|uniref:PRTRC system protein B n=1 Tax=Empedobacter brevis NBRC 14943 = ATCC 43319 TaxID=1218108 RepID=A0A511NJ82_9FLAO|nr:PRTRC system protein B [Empedobacter brevis]GEM52757.1 hypothetical protein EB1_25470 [Empedobacter brevis NBRC 14943 = ATCC 43319]
MSNVKNITKDFGVLYHPVSALVFYQNKDENTTNMYVEHFDMDTNGNPVNAHPLTVQEANALAKSLHTADRAFLQPNGILPISILHINSGNGTVIWYTTAQQRQLYFVDSLQIPNGKAQVPPMLWKATKNSLSVFAMTTDRRPTENSELYHAPFFNMYEDGKVCMGTVDVNIKNSASVEEFTQAWETYFFNSYFSHLLGNHNPIKGNCVTLWKKLIQTDEAFPKEVLKPNNKTLKNLL